MSQMRRMKIRFALCRGRRGRDDAHGVGIFAEDAARVATSAQSEAEMV